MNGNNGNGGDPVYIDDECRKRWKEERAFIREEEEHSINKRCKNCRFVLCAAVVGAIIAGIFLIIATGLLALPPVEIEQTGTPSTVVVAPPVNGGDNGDDDKDDGKNSVVINLDKLIIKGDGDHKDKKHDKHDD